MFCQIYNSLQSVCLFTERTVSEVTSNRDEVEEANQTLHGNFKLGLPYFFLILILKVFFFFTSPCLFIPI